MSNKRSKARKRAPKHTEVAMLPSDYPDEMPPRDAARYLHTTERTLYEWTKEGRIAHIRLSPKKIIYLKVDLDRLKQGCRIEAKPAPAA